MGLNRYSYDLCHRQARAVHERTGMQAGMPRAEVDANHLERVLVEHKALEDTVRALVDDPDNDEIQRRAAELVGMDCP